MSQISQVGIVVFGLGRAGLIHAGNLMRNTRVHLKWIVEQYPEKAKTFVAENVLDTEVVHMSDTDHVLADKSVQAVVITTPTPHHEDLILRSLRAGKHVFCEKPIAITRDAVVRCYEEAESHGLTLFCALNRRFDPTHRSVALRAKAGEVGQIQLVKTTSRDSPFHAISYLASSGGIFHDCGVHDVDNVMNIIGEAPKSVFALGNAFYPEVRALGDFDTVSAMMKFPSGTICQIDMARHTAYGYDQRLEVFGSEGMLIGQNLHQTGAVLSNKNGITTDKTLTPYPLRFANSYAAEMEHFLDVISKKAEPEVVKDDVLCVMRVLDALEKSCKTGKVVTLDG